MEEMMLLQEQPFKRILAPAGPDAISCSKLKGNEHRNSLAIACLSEISESDSNILEIGSIVP